MGKLYNRDNWVWVGLEKTLNNKVLLAKDERGPENYNASEWQWLDGTHPKYTKWMRDMPDQVRPVLPGRTNGKHCQSHYTLLTQSTKPSIHSNPNPTLITNGILITTLHYRGTRRSTMTSRTT